jgi:hypothetical protein
MKKVKVTRKPQSRQDFLLQPSRVRMATIYAIFFALAVIAGMVIRLFAYRENANLALITQGWETNLAIVVGGSVLFALMDYSRWTIKVLNGENIEGPSGAMGARALLPLSEIDWARSGHSLRSRLKIGNAIYTNERKRILISPWFYDPKPFAEFLERIGYDPEKK